ncbi:MAG: hypothetical protein ACT4O0_03100 [Pseudonocardia sp.]
MSAAVRAAEAASGEWRAAVVAQRSAAPDHDAFYLLASELVSTLYALRELTRTLGGQVAGYGEGRAVYDDSREVDPHARLAEAAAHLAATGEHLQRAALTANAYWSAIGHVGVEIRS